MAPNFTCNYCDNSFARNFCLRRHMRSVHNISLEKYSNKGIFCCPICKERLCTLSDFTKHSLDKHDISIKNKQIEFESSDEFLKWKSNTEKNTNTCFIRKRAERRRTTGTACKTVNYYCNRSGFFHPRPTDNKRIRKIRLQGSRKINGFCPCSITAIYYSNGKVMVNYCITHIGHTTDFAHLPLNCDTVRRSNDAVSVDAWVREEMLSEHNCVLLYKPQHNIYQSSALKKEDFALAIMTPAQRDILAKFGNDCICIDSTHALNAYGIEAATLMVLDDMRQGFPCAFFLCSRIDRETISEFFSCIKKQVGVLQPSVFMSDLAESFYDAWLSTMGPVQHRLYCSWHVDRAWQKNLTKIKVKEKRSEVYKKLRTLLEETNETAFLSMLGPIIKSMCDDKDTCEYGHYFKERYGRCFKMWAYCFRKNCGVNMHLERMHRTIQYLYRKGKTVKRLDKAIYAITQFTKQKLFDRLTLSEKDKIRKKIKELRARHISSLKMNTDLITPNNDASWEVASSSNNRPSVNPCTVRLIDPNCVCHIVCTQCSACLHKYSCTCIDACIKLNMCKHIHLLCRKLKLLESTNAKPNFDDVVESSLCINETKGLEEKQAIKQVGLQEIEKLKVDQAQLLDEFQNTVDDMTSLEETFDSVSESSFYINETIGLEEKQAIKQVGLEESDKLNVDKAQLLDEFQKVINDMTSLEETKIGKEMLKLLQTKLTDTVNKIKTINNNNNCQ